MNNRADRGAGEGKYRAEGSASPAGQGLGTLDRLGGAALGWVRYVLLLLAFFYLAIKMVWVERRRGGREVLRQVLLQVYFTGVQGVVPVAGLAVVVGFLAIAHGLAAVGPLSGGDALGRFVTLVVLREVAPLLTVGVVIVRSVNAIAAELGVMRVQREIEALEVMGISPILHLVTPRLAGGVAALLALNVVFGGVAVATGLLAAGWFGSVPPQVVMAAVLSALSPDQLLGLAAKIVVAGVVVFLIGCYHGLEVADSPTQVPVAVSRAALRALVFSVVWHALVSLATLAASQLPWRVL